MSDAVKEIEGLLEGQLSSVRKTNQRSTMIGGIALLLIGGYLAWAHSQFSQLLDPEGLAFAATGMTLEAIPEASQALRSVVVDGAPDIAQAASQAVVDMLPAYREIMEEEMRPVIDEVATVLAQTTVQQMVKSAEAGRTGEGAQQAALQAGADAVVDRFDDIIGDALDQPGPDDGPTPREAIDASLEQLQTIDRGLKTMARGGGDPMERELLLTWLGLIGQAAQEADAAAIDAYKSGERVED